MKEKLTIAGIQMSSGLDKTANMERAGKLIEVAAERGATIASLPQLFNTHWFPCEIKGAHRELAEESSGPTVTAMREIAQRLKMILICPIFERDGDAFYNTAFVIDESGELIGRYRKVHVPQLPLWEERSYFSPGSEFPVFETRYGVIGVQLCWDIFFPEAARVLALKGARIIFTPTSSAFYPSHAKWDRAAGASAHANGIYIFRVNRVGKEDKQEFYGRSFCVDPYGEFVDKPSGHSDGVVLASIDLGEVERARNTWSFLQDRRVESYKEIVEVTCE
ncbi:MAG: nitrilase-related carbon-nitrogen hydrolase [Thermodesulfobacteriota bacterium]